MLSRVLYSVCYLLVWLRVMQERWRWRLKFARKRWACRRLVQASRPPYSPTEQAISRETGLPICRAAAIYRMGWPWPTGFEDFEREVREKARELGLSPNVARHLLRHRLMWHWDQSGRIVDPVFESLTAHCVRVATATLEPVWIVAKVQGAVLKYAQVEGKRLDPPWRK